jgi:hypothetical protein
MKTPNVVHLTDFVHKLYELFPDLRDFDVKTDERCLFKESLEALQRVLPEALKGEPLVVGTYLLKIMTNPEYAGSVITEAYKLVSPFTWQMSGGEGWPSEEAASRE